MAKPTSKPDWTVGNPSFGTVTVEPSAGKKQIGWTPSEKPPREFMNWLFWIIGEWINYFETTTDSIVAQALNYDAIVGVGGTHATINDAIAAVSAGSKILVKDSFSLTATQVVNKDDIVLEFKPGKTLSKDTAILGLQITSNRVKVIGGRFSGFSGVGDKAIEVSAAAKNVLITQSYFINNETDVDDQGSNTNLVSNVNEVV